MVNQGLKGITVAQTMISEVDGENGRLSYRGYDVMKLINCYSFEDVAFLIWTGSFPTEEQSRQLLSQLHTHRQLTKKSKELIQLLPNDLDMMSVIRTVISANGSKHYTWKPSLEQAITLTAMIPSIITYRFHRIQGTDCLEPKKELGHVANYLYMLKGEEQEQAIVKALETYMILTMEHSFNASTFSARVTASTEADIVSAVTAAISTMKGPLHGGAPTGVLQLIADIQTKERAETVIRGKVQSGEKLMGFGHRIYRTHDPRSLALREVLKSSVNQNQALDLAIAVEEAAVKVLEEEKPGRKLYTNVEFYAAAIMNALELDASLFSPTFTASRIVGWTAHVLEQAEHNVIYRPKAEYVGKKME
ncbi:citrate synthase/methylcitrate synthase [Alkalihalobacillus pseudalcaliphilus]|uniref:citrate synthase/methylcitrate synthase n=1 Tax=Alkalihalobacillus pseudalcaliphilus TaxID=79884 RepID=UPI00064DA9E0|nr:citrate synthase/methylcitrate synthase [Alkalihalobacillus pseudalcaliphilus]KMK75882.1 citrate synthase [Alkalihalobacillus pseudalcaliphilus]